MNFKPSVRILKNRKLLCALVMCLFFSVVVLIITHTTNATEQRITENDYTPESMFSKHIEEQTSTTKSRENSIIYRSIIAKYDFYMGYVHVNTTVTETYNYAGHYLVSQSVYPLENARNITIYDDVGSLNFTYQNNLLTWYLRSQLNDGETTTVTREYNIPATLTNGIYSFSDSISATENLTIRSTKHDIDIIKMAPSFNEYYNRTNTSDLQLSVQYTPKVTLHKLEYNYTITNTGSSTAFVNATIISPVDVASQTIISYTITPTPNATLCSTLGNTPFQNKFLLYNFSLAPGAQRKISIASVTRVENIIQEGINGSGSVPSQLLEYTSSNSTYWQNISAIRNKAIEISQNSTTALEKITNISKFVYTYLTYHVYADRHGAEWAYSSRIGDCEEYSDLTIDMLRIAGIPAFRVGGYVNIGHAWVTAYVPGYGWYFFDPTWNFTTNLDNTRVVISIDNPANSPIEASYYAIGATPNVELSFTDWHAIISDIDAPDMDTIYAVPNAPTDMDNLTMCSNISDETAISSVTLWYNVNNGSEKPVDMTVRNNTYTADLGQFRGSDTIYYRIIATDIFGNVNTSETKELKISSKRPDLAVTSINAKYPSSVAVEGDNITITATIVNNGWVNATSVLIRLFDGSPSNSTQVINKSVSQINGKETINISVNWTGATGRHDLFVRAECAENESNYENNLASISIVVYKAFKNLTNLSVQKNSTSVFANETIILNGSITAGGTIVISNSTVVLNSTGNKTIGIDVKQGGTLEIRSSRITNADNSSYYFDIYGNSVIDSCEIDGFSEIRIFSNNVTISNNTIYNCSGIAIYSESSSPAITNNYIFNNTIGIKLLNSSSVIFGNTIGNNGYGIILENSSANITENTFLNNAVWDIYAVSSIVDFGYNNFTGNLSMQHGLFSENWVITGKVVDYNNNSVADALVEIKDVFGNIVWSGTTNTNGRFAGTDKKDANITLTQLEYLNNNTTKVHTPYIVKVSKNDTTSSSSVVVDGNRDITITIDERVDIMISNFTIPAGYLKESESFNVTIIVSLNGSRTVSSVPIMMSLNNESNCNFTLYNLSQQNSVEIPIKLTLATGRYYIKLIIDPTKTINDRDENNNEVDGVIYVHGIPCAVIKIPSTAHVNEDAAIDGTLSTGADSLSYYYDFGDSLTSDWTNESKVNHRYYWPGSYPISLKVKDSTGIESNQSSATILIVNDNPIAKIENKYTTANTGELVYFDGSNSTDADSDKSTLIYTWDFGDGATSHGVQATHAYNKSGSYNVTLKVNDMNGGASTDTLKITINETTKEKKDVTKEKGFVPYVSWYCVVGVLVVIGVFARLYSKKRP